MELKCAVHVDAGMINAAISTLHIIGCKPLSLIFYSTIIIVLGIFIHYQKFQFGGKGCGSFTCCPPTLIIFLYTTAKTKQNIPFFHCLVGGEGSPLLDGTLHNNIVYE